MVVKTIYSDLQKKCPINQKKYKKKVAIMQNIDYT